MTIRYLQDISEHFKWYKSKIKLSCILYEGFKDDESTLDMNFLKKLSNEVAIKFKNEISCNLGKGYLFILIENQNDSKIDNYFKIWKKLAKTHDISKFTRCNEEKIESNNKKYFAGLAEFNSNHIDIALSIQKDFLNSSFIILETSNDPKTILLKDSITFLLEENQNIKFSLLFEAFVKKGMIVVRIGDGGEDVEYDFVFCQSPKT